MMKKRLNRELTGCRLIFTACLVIFHSLQAGLVQNNTRLSGQVYDAENRTPLAGVAIQVEETEYGTVSDESGFFAIENIPPGAYGVQFFRLGYRPAKIAGVRISEDIARSLSIGLRPSPIEMEMVTVTSEAREALSTIEGEKIVLSRNDIEQYRGLGLPRLLQQVAGLQVQATGGGSSRATISIHGSRSSQVLVLLDGQKLNNPQTGEVNLNEIPLEQLEKIEVIRQGNTAIFGGNAFAGVILLKTTVKPSHYGEVRSQFGSFSTAMGHASLGLSPGLWGVMASYEQDYSRQNFTFDDQGKPQERQNAWYQNRHFFTRLNYRRKQHQLGLIYNLRDGKQGLPSAFFEEQNHFSAFSKATGGALQLQYRWFFLSKAYLESLLAYHALQQSFNNEKDPSPFTRYHTQQSNQTYEGKLNAIFFISRFLEGRIGAQYFEEALNQEDLLFPSHSIGKKQRHSIAGFGSAELSIPSIEPLLRVLKLRGALRYEAYFDQPGKWYPFVGLSMVPDKFTALSFSTSWTKSIRYPDFNSLFWKGDTRARGNPELFPEENTLWNASVRFSPVNPILPVFSIYYFAEELINLIYWHRTVNGIWEPRNVERARKRGLDIELEQKVVADHLRLQAAYSYIQATNKSEEPNRHNKRIVFTPQHTLNGSLWFGLGPADGLLIYRLVSEREVVPANSAGTQLDQYQLWDFSLTFRQPFGKVQLECGGGIKNITAEQYQLLRGYPMPGKEIHFSVALKYQP